MGDDAPHTQQAQAAGGDSFPLPRPSSAPHLACNERAGSSGVSGGLLETQSCGWVSDLADAIVKQVQGSTGVDQGDGGGGSGGLAQGVAVYKQPSGGPTDEGEADLGLEAVDEDIDVPNGGNPKDDKENSVIVTGLPPDITDEELKDLCGIHGRVLSTSIFGKRWGGCIATVQYEDRECARAAAELMHGHTVLGAKLRVEVGTKPSSHSVDARAQQPQRQVAKSRAVLRNTTASMTPRGIERPKDHPVDAKTTGRGSDNNKRRISGDTSAGICAPPDSARAKASHISYTTSAAVKRARQLTEQQPKQSEMHTTSGLSSRLSRAPRDTIPAKEPSIGRVAGKLQGSCQTRGDAGTVGTSGEEAVDDQIFADEFLARVAERMGERLDGRGQLKRYDESNPASRSVHSAGGAASTVGGTRPKQRGETNGRAHFLPASGMEPHGPASSDRKPQSRPSIAPSRYPLGPGPSRAPT